MDIQPAFRGRRNLIGGILAIGAFAIAGCAAVVEPDGRYYPESIDSIKISSDKKHLAVFGKDYHYVINTTPRFMEIMESPYRARLRASFELLRVEPRRDVMVYVKLGIDTPGGVSNPANAEIAKLLVRTRQPASPKDDTLWSEALLLTGHRYDNTRDTQVSVSEKLNHAYQVRVYEDPSAMELDIYRKSPVTLAKGVAGAIVWLPVFLMFQVHNM